MALSKRARGYAISIPVVTAFSVFYFTVPAFQSNANVVFGWIKSFRQRKHHWDWIIAFGVIGLVGFLCVLAIIAQWCVAGMVKREEIRTGRMLKTNDADPSDSKQGGSARQ